MSDDNCCNVELTLSESPILTLDVLGDSYIGEMPTMSTVQKGGAKVGAGLEVDSDEFLNIAPSGVVSSMIDNAAITTEKIADGAVTADKIADTSITPAKLSNSVLDMFDGNVKAFDTVAGMQADSNLQAGDICHTNGFHSAGDGGAAFYKITATGTANGMDVLACGDVFANLVINENYVTPEQFGACGDGVNDDTAVIQYAIDTHKSVTLQGLYVISDTLRIHDLENGCFGSTTPFSSETLSKVASTGIYCKGMVGKAAISLCGCLNYELKNFGIFSFSDVTTDGPSVGIYCGRSGSHLSSQWNNITGVGIQLGNASTLNDGNGSIGIYNNAAEEFSIENCSIRTNIGIVHTDKDCLSLASLGNSYNYSSATCSVISNSNLSMCCETAFLMSYVSSIYFDDVFYANVDTYNTPILFKSDFTNSTANYWNNVQAKCVSCEQNVSALKLIAIGAYTLNSPIHIDNCYFDAFVANNQANNYLQASQVVTTVFVNTTVCLKDNQSGNNVIFDSTNYLCNFTGCHFYTYSYVALTNCLGTFTSKPNQQNTKYGSFGGDITNTAFPFQISGRIIGVSWGQPTLAGCQNGSICLCTNPDSPIALWVYKNGWIAVNISS